MQAIKTLSNWLENNASSEHDVFSSRDLRILFLDLSDAAFRALLSRATKGDCLERICRNLYRYKKKDYSEGRLLYHAAAHLRGHRFNYISLETVLSDAGVISQIPINVISIMSSGRSNTIDCGRFGSIEFIHTQQKPTDLRDQLTYDAPCRLWRASVQLALKDMKKTHRNADLIDWERAHEFI